MNNTGWLAWKLTMGGRRLFILPLLLVASSVAVLLVISAVAGGFDQVILDKVLTTTAHVKIQARGARGFPDWQNAVTYLGKKPEITALAPRFTGDSILDTDNFSIGLRVVGVMPKYESQCSPRLASALSTLLSPSTENWLLMGEALRKQLGVTVGDSISMRGVSGDHDFLLAGTFSVGLHDYDSSFVFIDFAMAQSFFEYPGIATAIQLRLKNPDDAPKVSQEIEGEFPEIQARSWQELNGALLGTMAVERLVMRLIIILVSLLSLVGVGLLIFVILEERKKIIGVFETFGMARRQIRQLFFLEGMIISSVGIMLGVCGGLALSWLIGKIQIPLPEEIYVTYGSKVLPVAFQGSEILFILSSAAFASVFMVHLTTGRILRLKIIDLLKN